MLKHLTACNTHEYGSKSIYRHHMACLNASWLTTIMSTASTTRVMANNYRIYHQHMECLNHGLMSMAQHMELKYLMANNNHEYGSKSIYRHHMECLNT